MPTSFKGKDAATSKYYWVSVKGTKKDTKKRLSGLLNQLDNGLPLNLVRLPGQKIWRGGF